MTFQNYKSPNKLVVSDKSEAYPFVFEYQLTKNIGPQDYEEVWLDSENNVVTDISKRSKIIHIRGPADQEILYPAGTFVLAGSLKDQEYVIITPEPYIVEGYLQNNVPPNGFGVLKQAFNIANKQKINIRIAPFIRAKSVLDFAPTQEILQGDIYFIVGNEYSALIPYNANSSMIKDTLEDMDAFKDIILTVTGDVLNGPIIIEMSKFIKKRIHLLPWATMDPLYTTQFSQLPAGYRFGVSSVTELIFEIPDSSIDLQVENMSSLNSYDSGDYIVARKVGTKWIIIFP